MKYTATIVLLTLVSLSVAAAPKRRAAVNQEQMQQQVLQALDNYDLDTAEDLLDQWESGVAKGQLSSEHELLSARRLLMENMLERVEAITIARADTIEAASMQDVMLPVRLASGGTFYGSRHFAEINDNLHDSRSTGFIPASGREIIWSGPKADNSNADKGETPRTLYQAGYLSDGSLDGVRTVFDDDVIEQYNDMTTPFLAEDGLTLYFGARNDENGIGGFDIYRAVRQSVGDRFSSPSNMGMPYSSPGDDVLYALDPDIGVGYWVSNRGVDSTRMVLYTFIPNVTRVNRVVDEEEYPTGDYAAIRTVGMTWAAGFDPATVKAMPSADTGDGDDIESLSASIYIPSRRKMCSRDDMQTAEARSMMDEYADLLDTIADQEMTLEEMRRKYARGQRELAGEITRAENEVEASRTRLVNLSNRIVTLESAN